MVVSVVRSSHVCYDPHIPRTHFQRKTKQECQWEVFRRDPGRAPLPVPTVEPAEFLWICDRLLEDTGGPLRGQDRARVGPGWPKVPKNDEKTWPDMFAACKEKFPHMITPDLLKRAHFPGTLRDGEIIISLFLKLTHGQDLTKWWFRMIMFVCFVAPGEDCPQKRWRRLQDLAS